jgi:hypothetical protein
MQPKTVTYVSEQVLPTSPVHTKSWVGGWVGSPGAKRRQQGSAARSREVRVESRGLWAQSTEHRAPDVRYAVCDMGYGRRVV